MKGNFVRGQNSSKYRESLNKVRNNPKNGQCALKKKKEKNSISLEIMMFDHEENV